MRFALINTVPPGFCRKMHLLAPGGALKDLAELRRDELPSVGLSPTNIEAIQGFVEWNERGISPAAGLLMWYMETVQLSSGGFLRTDDAPEPSIGVAIRYLQIAGQLGVRRHECESVDRAARWLESQVGDDGLIRMPISGNVDYGMLARSIRSLSLVETPRDGTDGAFLDRACAALDAAQTATSVWPTYPGGTPSTGATSLALSAIVQCNERFDGSIDPSWLLEGRSADGGWGEYADSPSRIDNTFWGARACRDVGEPIDGVAPALWARPESNYETAMAHRLAVVLEVRTDDEVEDLAMRSLTDDTDRYAETSLYGLALTESLVPINSIGDQRMPVRTPDFLRREPPLYDQLVSETGRGWSVRLIDRAAAARIAESSIGWMAGLWAAIALIGEEFVNGLAALPLVPLLGILGLEVLLAIGWLAARQGRDRRLSGLPHLVCAGGLATLLVMLLTGSEEVVISWLPTVALVALLALVVEVVSVATDKADLLNRLGDD